MSKQHYLQQTCPTGSTLYYTLLYQSGSQREAMILIEAFYQAILNIIHKVSEPSIAQAKLQWWREEINRMHQEKANHPITKTLQTHTKRFKLAQSQFIEIIDGVFDYIQNPAFETEQSLYTFYCRTAGSKELLKIGVIKKIKPEIIKPIYKASAGIAMVENPSLSAQILEKAKIYLAEKSIPQPLRIHAAISSAILKKQADILPLRKLFIAWKNK